MAGTTGTKAAGKVPAKASARASKGQPASTKTSKPAATRKSSGRAVTDKERSGEAWEAAKEILTAHRTLARAERRETTLAAALKTHGNAAKTLQAELKKVHKLLERADEELASSVKARAKAAERLHDVEQRGAPKGKKTRGKK